MRWELGKFFGFEGLDKGICWGFRGFFYFGSELWAVDCGQRPQVSKSRPGAPGSHVL